MITIGSFHLVPEACQFTALNAFTDAGVPQSLMSNTSIGQQFFLSFAVALAALLLHFSTRGMGATTLRTSNFTPGLCNKWLISELLR